MSLHFASLNSGSNGNCYYVGNNKDAVLIDAGLLCSETEKRMQRLNLSLHNVRAIFITHEHSDHVKGLPSIFKKYKIPIYITDKTKAQCKSLFTIDTIDYRANAEIKIGSLAIKSFLKLHDAVQPHSFTITHKNKTVGVFTDIGTVCNNLKLHFANCQAAILEANYDDEMLTQGKYPAFLKERISGTNGHLSNAQALELFINHKSPILKKIMLGHLSKDNNDPTLVQNLFLQHASGVEVAVASRYNESELHYISDNATHKVEKYYQTSLF